MWYSGRMAMLAPCEAALRIYVHAREKLSWEFVGCFVSLCK